MKSCIKGYSLVELLIVLLLVSVCLVGTSVSYHSIQQKNVLTTIKDQLRRAIQYAKMAAISQDRAMYLAALPDKKNWNSGIGLYDAVSQKILYEWHWKTYAWQIEWEGFSSGKHLLIAAHPKHAASNGQIIIHNTQTGEEERLIINRMGRVRSK